MVRQAKQEDLSRLAEIHVCGWRYAYRGMASDYELFVERQVVKSIRSFEEVLRENPEDLAVYEDSDRIVKGFAVFGKNRDNLDADVGEIQALYVQPEFTRSGVGSCLVADVGSLLFQKGFKKVVVWALEKNVRALSFYEKNGFRRDGAKRETCWKQGEVRFLKELPDQSSACEPSRRYLLR